MPLDFRILGPLEVVDRGSSVALGGPKQRALLAILVLHRGQVVSSERLIDQLWGDHPPASATKTLQGYLASAQGARPVTPPPSKARTASHPWIGLKG